VNQLKVKTCGWWTFKHNLYPTLGRHKDITRKMLMNIAKTNKISRLETKHSFDDKTSKHFNLQRNWITKDLVHSPSWNKSILWHFNSNFQFPWKFIMFNFLLETYHTSTIPKKIHLWKLIVNKNMKWRMFLTQGYQIINSNTSFISVDMMWANAFGNPLYTLLNHMEKLNKFHQ
jgi:hypothetical protein